MGSKYCSGCGVEKELDHFYRHKKSKDGHQGYCKPCANIKLNDYRKNNPTVIKTIRDKSLRKTRYGILDNEYQQKLKEQKNLCAICCKECVSGRNLAVDHNHATGQIRGLLCSNCNTSLGGFRDDVALLQEAIKYLEKYANN